MNIYIHTFGCKLNKYESEKISYELTNLGLNITDIKNANAIAINTCTVTKDSDKKLILFLNSIADINNKIIFLIGCYVSKEDAENNAEIQKENIILISNNEKENATNIIYNILIKADGSNLEKTTALFFPQEQSRAFLKIQDGCSVFCSYCIVSRVRGKNKNVPPNEIYQAVKEAKNNNYKEIVFTGLNLGSYNYENINFSYLVESVMELCAKLGVRLRLSSIEPIYFDKHLISLFAEKNKKVLAAHAHIPLQSGSDKILKLMNRRYDRKYFKNIVEELYKQNEYLSITTDVMVGFPYEDENDFNDSYSLCEFSKMLKMHIFRYSKREGTPAFNMENQVAIRQKVKRADMLNKLNTKLNEERYKSFLERKLDVVIEKELNNSMYEGTAGEYLKVEFQSDIKLQKKMLVSVKADGYTNKILTGSII